MDHRGRRAPSRLARRGMGAKWTVISPVCIQYIKQKKKKKENKCLDFFYLHAQAKSHNYDLVLNVLFGIFSFYPVHNGHLPYVIAWVSWKWARVEAAQAVCMWLLLLQAHLRGSETRGKISAQRTLCAPRSSLNIDRKQRHHKLTTCIWNIWNWAGGKLNGLWAMQSAAQVRQLSP